MKYKEFKRQLSDFEAMNTGVDLDDFEIIVRKNCKKDRGVINIEKCKTNSSIYRKIAINTF